MSVMVKFENFRSTIVSVILVFVHYPESVFKHHSLVHIFCTDGCPCSPGVWWRRACTLRVHTLAGFPLHSLGSDARCRISQSPALCGRGVPWDGSRALSRAHYSCSPPFSSSLGFLGAGGSWTPSGWHLGTCSHESAQQVLRKKLCSCHTSPYWHLPSRAAQWP